MTASRDGRVRCWFADTLKYSCTFASGLGWVTSMVHMAFSNRLAVATTRQVILYDVLANHTGRLAGSIPTSVLRHSAPLALCYRYEPLLKRETLFIGDDEGSITCYVFLKKTTGGLPLLLDPANCPPHVKFQDHVDLSRFSIHSDHITQITFSEDLGCTISASLDGTVKIVQLDEPGRKYRAFSRMRTKFEFKGHPKGCNGFAWCTPLKLVASCGHERHIALWSPYSTSEPQHLTGHMASVVQVISNDEKLHLFSLDASGVVKIWDSRTAACLQTLHPGHDEVGATPTSLRHVRKLFLDGEVDILVMASHSLSLYAKSEDEKRREVCMGQTARRSWLH